MFVNSSLYFMLKKSFMHKYLRPLWRVYYSCIQSYYMKREAANLLYDLKVLFDKNNLVFWLDFGTLLGAYREHDFISHDGDIDLAVEASDMIKISKSLAGTPFILDHKYFVDDQLVQLTYRYRHITVDICAYFNNNNKTYSCYLCSFVNGVSNPVNSSYETSITECIVPFNGELCQYEFKGHEYRIPLKIHEYLTAHYGPDFMCPNPNFDSTKDAPNIIKIPLEKKKGVCYYGKE